MLGRGHQIKRPCGLGSGVLRKIRRRESRARDGVECENSFFGSAGGSAGYCFLDLPREAFADGQGGLHFICFLIDRDGCWCGRRNDLGDIQ